MKALITGGAGFIGSHLAQLLLEDDWKVHILDDLSTGCEDNLPKNSSNLHFHLGCVTESENVRVLVALCDVVFHLAAVVGVQHAFNSPGQALRINIKGTENVLRAAGTYNKRVLVVSSSEVYGYGNGSKPKLEESDPVLLGTPTSSMRWAYGVSKLVDEFMAIEAFNKGLEAVVVRPFNVVGPRQVGHYGMVLPRFIKQALNGEPITVYGTGEQTRCFAYVAEVAQAFKELTLCDAAVGQVVNVAGFEEVTINYLARRVKELAGSDSPINHVPYEEAYGPGFDDAVRRSASTDKLRSLLGWVPKLPLDLVIMKTIEWSQRQC